MTHLTDGRRPNSIQRNIPDRPVDCLVEPVPPKRRRILATVLTIVLHLVLAGVLVDAGIRWSVGTLSIVAGLTFLLIFLMIALSYLRNFGSKSVDFVRSGPMGLDRPHVLFVGMTTVGYLVLLLVLGSALGPGTFLWFFFGFWILFALFLVVLVIAARNFRREIDARLPQEFVESLPPRKGL